MNSQGKEELKSKPQRELQPARIFPSCRLTLGIIGLFGGIAITLMRNNLSVGIVCMTIDPEDNNNNTSGNYSFNQEVPLSFVSRLFPNYRRSRLYPSMNDELENCPNEETSGGGTGETGEFDWSDELQGVILSSSAYGYIATQLLGGYLVGRFGAKKTIFCAITLSTVSTLVGPLASIVSPYLLITTQVLNGLGQGVYFPCFFDFWSRWAPPFERTKLINLILIGSTLGTIISLFMSGYLCEYLGWESLFYVYGVMGVLWLIGWLFLVYESPRVHPRISKEELNYIEDSLADTGVSQREVLTFWNIPWKGILTSRNIWMISLAQVCNGFGYNVAQKMLPQFMEDILRLPISENGLYSSIPHMATLVTTFSAAALADFLIRKGMRFMHLAPWSSPFRLVFLHVMIWNLALFCLAAWLAMSGFSRSGAAVSLIEVVPRYVGLAMGIVNTFTSLPGMIIPSIVAAMTPTGSQTEWRNVFFLTGGVYLFGGLAYLIFGGGDIEDWAKNPTKIDEGDKDFYKEKPKINPVFTLSKEKVRNGFKSKENTHTIQTQL